MGFKAPRTVLKLKFHDSDYEGFVVRIQRMTVEDAYLFENLPEWEKAIKAGEIPRDEANKRLQRMHERVAESIVEWNLEDDEDDPIPVSVASIRAQEPGFFWTIVRAWFLANNVVVDPDLKDESNSGEQYQEELIPMEPLLESLAS